MMAKNNFAFFCLAFFCSFSLLYATEKSADSWCIAACEFSSVQEGDQALQDVANLFPTLILENLSLPIKRHVLSEELLERSLHLKELSIEKLEKEWDSLQKKRDVLVVTDGNSSDYTTKLKKAKKDLNEIRKKIDIKKAEREGLKRDDFTEVFESVVLYKNDATQRYSFPSDGKKIDVQAVLEGSVSRVGSFLHIECFLNLYPAKRNLIKIEEVCSIESIDDCSKKISKTLLKTIQNTDLVSLRFLFLQKELSQFAKIQIDGEPVELNDDKTVVVSSGFHDLSFFAKGYKTIRINADFSQKKRYSIDIFFKKFEPVVLEIQKDKDIKELFINGIKRPLGEEIELPFLPALGQVISYPDATSWVIFNSSGNMRIKPLLLDQSSLIEKRRKALYTSYGMLLLSLPITFGVWGKYLDVNHSAYAYSNRFPNGTDSQIERYNNLWNAQKGWQIGAYSAAGVSAAFGVNMIVQLVLYILSVEGVLPQQPKSN